MAALAILFWGAVLAADIAFMAHIRRLADWLFPLEDEQKAPGRAGTRSKGRRHMTDLVYQIQKENARCYRQS